MAINLKPLRSYNENDVIPLFAFDGSSGNIGQIVTINSGWRNDLDFEWKNIYTSVDAYSVRPVVKARVRAANSGEGKGTVLGILLKNIRDTNFDGKNMIYDKTRLEEANAVASGQGVPVLVRGLVLVSGTYITGAGVAPNTGVKVANGGAGDWVLTGPTDTLSIGKFLGATGADGFALFKLEL
jgi:hypothetical protein